MPENTRLRIAIVDDTRAILQPLTRHFSYFSAFRVLPYSEPLTFLREFSSLDLDVALIDTQMPGINGIELCRSIRRSEARRFAIIGMSSSEDYREKWLEAGADEFFEKYRDFRKFESCAERIREIANKYPRQIVHPI